MHQIHFHYSPIEYLASTVAQHDHTGEEVVVLTLRSTPDQWQPCNVGITRSQAERLLHDLRRLLVATPLILMLLFGGCSTRVDVSTERSTGGESAAHHTEVAVDVLTDQEETPTPSPEPEQPPVSTTTEKRVEIAGIANFAMVIEGDLHVHEHHHEHLHIENRSKPNWRKAKPERIEVEIQRPSPDPECERLRREHLERVREWKAIMSR